MSVRKAGLANRIYALLLTLCIAASAFLLWSVQTHAEEKIPAYSGSASVVLNKNVPGFIADEITTSSFESYGELDKLGRVTTATACIGKDLMPTEERQSIGDVRPTGWKQNKYPGLVDSDPPYLYNRCHMIGFQLAGENANEKNLVTGTRYMNVREHRYTKAQLDKTGEFTISIPTDRLSPEIFKICGNQSGNNIDKGSEAHLSLEDPETIKTPGVKEAPITLECKILYSQQQDISRLPEDIRKNAYPQDVDGSNPMANRDAHTAYIGQIVDAYIIK